MKTTVLEGGGIKYVLLDSAASYVEVVRYSNGCGKFCEFNNHGIVILELGNDIALIADGGMKKVTCGDESQLLSPEEYTELCKQFPEWVR